MTNHELRALIIGNHNRIKQYLLTDLQVKVVLMFMTGNLRKYNALTSSEVGEQLGVSSNHAALVLKDLYIKGYLERERIPSATGYHYLYTTSVAIPTCILKGRGEAMKVINYTVKPGDTLGLIAKEYLGDAMRYGEIAIENGIVDPDALQIGQKLTITLDQLDEIVGVGQLKGIMPLAKNSNLEKYITPLNKKMIDHEINTPKRAAHFLAQIAHESAQFSAVEEHLNYSKDALMTVFGKYFKSEVDAEAYHRQPEMIANRVYANRMDNGSEESGDGWKYRGRGLIQLTGKANYRAYGQAIGVPLVESPDLVCENTLYTVGVATWYWTKHNLNVLADADDLKAITKAINGGYHGLADRERLFDRAIRHLETLA